MIWLWSQHWFFWIGVLLLILFVLWLLFGGGDYEFVGIAPLMEKIAPLPQEVCVVDDPTTAVDEARNFNFVVYSDDEIPNVPPPTNPSKWKRQEECCRRIEEIFGLPFQRDYRPSFLRNPETGGILELDCYNQDLGVALEHNGKQHYSFPNKFHKSKDEFIAQVRRDQYKVDACDRNGIYLVTIPYNIPFTHIKSAIREQLIPFLEVNRRDE